MIIESHPNGTPCWVDLSSPDLDGARRFYSAVLGWDWTTSGPEHGHYSQGLVDGQPVAGLGPLPTDSGARPAWTVYFATGDADATVGALQARGGGVVVPAMDVGPMGRMAIVSDPGGAVFGLWQPGEHSGSRRMGVHGATCWFEVNASDATAMQGFYADLFEMQREVMTLSGTPYFTLHKEGKPRAGVLQMDDQWEGVPPHWMVYFAVDDTDAAVERVREAGGSLCHGPFDTSFGRMAIVNDPAGAVFTLIKPPRP